MSGGGDDHGTPVPKFVIVGGSIIALIVAIVYVGIPVFMTGTCAVVGKGCSIPDQLWSSTNSRSGTAGPISSPGRPPGPQRGQTWVDNGRNDQCDGRPKNVEFTCVSPTSGKTVNCVCR